jgi:hypothetical protein
MGCGLLMQAPDMSFYTDKKRKTDLQGLSAVFKPVRVRRLKIWKSGNLPASSFTIWGT